jgi:hypothetical protein
VIHVAYIGEMKNMYAYITLVQDLVWVYLSKDRVKLWAVLKIVLNIYVP